MARILFRQGIVNHGRSPGQIFFLQQNGSDVDLFVSPQQTIIAFADGTKDYLFTEANTVTPAWISVSGPGNNWLYWDINRITGVRTFGSTTIAPLIQSTNPGASILNQMWFDTSTGNATSGQMHEYNGTVFVPVLRVFAAIYNGTTFVSPIDGVSVETNFTGSQVMLAGNPRNTGSLAFDSNGLPIINQNGKFFTTEDLFTTGIPDASALKINNIVRSAKADEPIGAFQAVVFTDFNQIGLASPFDFLDKVYGIVEQPVPTNSIANVVTEGIIFNELWDFSDTVGNPNLSGVINTPIYITNTGELTTNIVLSIPNAVVMGAIIGQHSIIFSPGLYGSTGMIVSSGNHGVLTGLLDDDHTQYLNNARGDLRYYQQSIADNIFVAVAGDTMTGSLILDADPVANLEAATKQYVDGVVGGGLANIIEDTSPQLGGALDVNGNNIVSTGGANINILPDGAGNVMLGTMELDSNQVIGGGQDNFVLTYDDGTGLVSLEVAATAGVTDHGALTGLGDNDHPQYVLVADSYQPLSINSQAGAAYSIVAGDAGGLVLMTSGAANIVTIPNDTTVIAIGTEILVQQSGAGTTTIAPQGPAIINSSGGFLNIAGQFDAISCIKIAPNTWTIIGNLV